MLFEKARNESNDELLISALKATLDEKTTLKGTKVAIAIHKQLHVKYENTQVKYHRIEDKKVITQ